MSNKVGRVALDSPTSHNGGPMGRMMGRSQTQWGGRILSSVDAEIERLVNNSYLQAKKILMDNRDLLDHLAMKLVEQEIVTAEEFQMMLVQFRAQTVGFEVLSDEKTHRDHLPFQGMPDVM
mmetsp:Transcript_65129/g.77101  ORF Transcript_65129/g.77101 Transcript_65129/m.77101 type:complete len:121 (+) Transcript_65129:3-365(+)